MDEYTEVTTTGFGSRLGSSIVGVILGLIIFAGSFGLIYWNEGRKDLSSLAKTSKEINAAEPAANQALNGQLVSATSELTSRELLGDGMFLKPGKYIAAERKVEMYAWVEHKHEQTRTNTGGSRTTTTTYDYVKEWTNLPENSSNFKYSSGHQNPQKALDDLDVRVKSAKVGAYGVDMTSVALPGLTKIQLDAQNTALSGGAKLVGGEYIFKGNGAYDYPSVGDLRISYSVLESPANVTIMGKLDGGAISAYVDQNNSRLYRIFRGTRDEAISKLHSEFMMMLWLFRGLGFLLMWMGLSMLFGPITVLLDVVPVAGAIGRGIVTAVCFVVSLILAPVAIFVSMIAHSIVALAVVFAAALAVVVVIGVVLGKKRAAIKRA